MIEATKTGVVVAEGIEVRHKAPALAMCRALLKAGMTDQPMTVVDANGRALLTVQSIADAAEMTVMENPSAGPRFVKWVPFSGIAGGDA
jgi:hypothetical protein